MSNHVEKAVPDGHWEGEASYDGVHIGWVENVSHGGTLTGVHARPSRHGNVCNLVHERVSQLCRDQSGLR